jgi:hypothetical protein
MIKIENNTGEIESRFPVIAENNQRLPPAHAW